MSKIFRPLHPSRCFYSSIWGIICGVVFSFVLQESFVGSWLWLLVAILLLIFALKRACIFSIILAFLAGLIFSNYRLDNIISSQNYLQQMVGNNVTISGQIMEDPEVDASGTTLRVHKLKVILPDNSETNELEAVAYVQLSGSHAELERSDFITLEGKLNSGFGTFAVTMYRPKLVAIQRSETGDIFARLKHWFAEVVKTFIPSPEVDLGLGYLMGIKSGLSASFSDALRIVGMTHVIVASGTHLGILVNLARRLFGKISRFTGVLFALMMILGFVLIVGFTPSMTRAGLVSALSLIVGYVGRKFTPGRLLSFVAAITLIINPTYIFNLGWQLSFASFFGILILAPKLQRALYGGKKPPWLASMLITSAATSLICAPILIYNFGTISLWSLVVNLVILPTLPYAMLLIFLTGALSFWPWLAHLVGKLATWLLDLHIGVVNFFSEQKMFVFELTAGDLRIFAIYILVSLTLLYPVFRNWYGRAKTRKKCYNEAYES